MSQRRYNSAMLIPPECACVSTEISFPSRNRTSSLPSVAMTQGRHLSCSNESDSTCIATNSLSNEIHDGFLDCETNVDGVPTLPCTHPVMVRAKSIGDGSDPDMGHVYNANGETQQRKTTKPSSNDVKNLLQKHSTSLLAVNFLPEASALLGCSSSKHPEIHKNCFLSGQIMYHSDNDLNLHHNPPRRKSFTDFSGNYLSSSAGNNVLVLNSTYLSPEHGELSHDEGIKNKISSNVSNVDITSSRSHESSSSNNVNNNIQTNRSVIDYNGCVKTSKPWSCVDLCSPFSTHDNGNASLSRRISRSAQIHPENDNDGKYLLGVSTISSVKPNFESDPTPLNCYHVPLCDKSKLSNHTSDNTSFCCGDIPLVATGISSVDTTGEIDRKNSVIIDMESDFDDTIGGKDTSLTPLLHQEVVHILPSTHRSDDLSKANNLDKDAIESNSNNNNNNNSMTQCDSNRNSFNEKQKRNRRFHRKNSSNLVISTTAYHRKEVGKAAKRLCLWKQKMAKSRQINSGNTEAVTTTNDVSYYAPSANTNTQTSFSAAPNISYADTGYHNENELLCSKTKTKNTTKQKAFKKVPTTPTIVISSACPNNGENPDCYSTVDNDTSINVDTDTIHSSDYDTIEIYPASFSNGNISQQRAGTNTRYFGASSSTSVRRPFRLRRNSRRLASSGHKAEFTVVPVKNETNLREQERSKSNEDSSSLRVPLSPFEIDGEPTDTLTQNSITSLLSAKFRDVAKRWKQYGVESPRFRKRIHSKWESMNYDSIDSKLSRELEHDTSKRKLAKQWIAQWFIYFLIGIGTALLAAGVQISVEIIAHEKFDLIKKYLDECSKEGCLIIPVVIWVGMNAGITLLGAALVTFVQPMAAGSGIPLIKSYLNGVRIPGLLSLRAFIAKCVGVILSILGGLACGKEGPMAHSGGIMGAGLGKGRIPWFNRDISLYGMFRNDHNIRDLVAAGAASGVSAAFGAPVGGTLFSVEEAASFWNTELVWKVFFSAMIACFSTNFLLSAFEGHPTQLSNPGLVRFNTFPSLTFDLIEIPVFIFLAVIGGLTGSLFVVMNYKLTVFRQKYLHRRKWIKVVEAAAVAVVSAVVAFVLMYTVNDCTEATPRSHHAILTKMGCEGKAHNSMSTLFLTTPEGCLKSLLHDPLDTYSVLTLVLFIVIFFLLGVWTYGLSVSSGVFIPSLAIGAAWGRLIGMGVVELFPDQSKAKDVGKYALIGAASQLGGILRTTISLTVIIVECTGDITFGLCIMISLMISKWVGDFFTTGLYDMNVEVSGIPLLSWEPPPLCDHVKVIDFMSQPVMSLLQVEKVGHVMECLKGESFHGFPIIEQDPNYDLMYKGKLKGLILRSQLLVLLKNKAFCPEGEKPKKIIDLRDFENPYPVSQRLLVEDIDLAEEEKEYVIDLGPYMSQTPYIVSPNFSMPRTFRLFRGLGLRHLIVINTEFEPVGMVTRKDLAKYRAGIKKGMLHMEQLTVENR